MKCCFLTGSVMVVLVSGCTFQRSPPANTAPVSVRPTNATSATAAEPKVIVTPEKLLVGTVNTYNTAGRFVVLDFPIGLMPQLDQLMFVYRQGLKVGELKITGPQNDYKTVADLIFGEARKGDEVRDR